MQQGIFLGPRITCETQVIDDPDSNKSRRIVAILAQEAPDNPMEGGTESFTPRYAFRLDGRRFGNYDYPNHVTIDNIVREFIRRGGTRGAWD